MQTRDEIRPCADRFLAEAQRLVEKALAEGRPLSFSCDAHAHVADVTVLQLTVGTPLPPGGA